MTNIEGSLYRKATDFLDNGYDKITETPSLGLLVAMGLIVFYFIGIILDWDWTLQAPGSGNFIQRWVHSRSRKTVRIFYVFYASIAIILLICLGYMYYYNTFR